MRVKNNLIKQIKHYFKVPYRDIKNYLLSLNTDILSDELINYDKFLSSNLYKILTDNNNYKYRIDFKEPEILDIFTYLESLNVDLNKFLYYVIYKVSKNSVDEKKEKLENILSKQNVLEDVVKVSVLRSHEDDILDFFHEFLLQHNEMILSNEDIILNKEQQENIKIKIHNFLLDLIKLCKTNNIDSIPVMGNNVIEVYEFYKKDKLLNEKVTSKLLRALLYTMRDLCYSDIISDNFRFNILKLYFEVWILKTNIVIEESNNCGFRWDFSKTKYSQAKFIKQVNGNHPELEKYNAYLSNDIEFKNEIYLLPFYYIGKGTKHKSHYIKPHNAKKSIISKDDNTIEISNDEYNKLTEEEKEKYYFQYDNKNYLNVYNDTETSWLFRLPLQIPELKVTEIKLSNRKVIPLLKRQIISITDNGEVNILKAGEFKNFLNDDIKFTEIENKIKNKKVKYELNLTREDFLLLHNENIKHQQSIDINTLKKLKQNDLDNENSLICDELLKHKFYAVSEIKVHQSCFVNEKTKQVEYVMFVDNRNKDQYGENYLNYTYNQKIKEISKEKTINAKIIYTDNVINTYFEYLINWYRNQHNDIDSKRLNCRCWYHNLKFDSLAIGLQHNFINYNWELKNFKTTTPVFFKFDIPFEIENRKGKTIETSIEFVDSFNFINESLERLGLQVGIRKEKEKVNFNWNNNLNINKEFLEYSIMDIEILKECMEDLKNIALKYGTFTKYGAAGTALNSLYSTFYGKVKDEKRPLKRYKTNYIDVDGNELNTNEYKSLLKQKEKQFINDLGIKTKDSKNNEEFKNMINEFKTNQIKKVKVEYDDFKKVLIHKHKNRLLEEIEQFCYFGGRTQVFRKIGEFKKYISIDINSSYPTAMLQKIPYEYKTSLNCENMSKYDINKKLHEIFKSKNEYIIARVYIPHDNHRIVPVKRESMVCFDELYNTTTVLHEPELKLLIERNKNIKILEIHICYASDQIFKEFVDEFMFSKSFHKSITGDKISVTWAKLNNNSVYGKFAEKELISTCKQLNEDSEIELFTILLSLWNNREVSEDELKSYIGYIDIPLDNLRLHNAIGIHNDICQLYDNDIIDTLLSNQTFINIKNQISINESSLRIEFFSNYYSFSKKTDKPGDKASLLIAGSITSYARSNLYKAIEIIGFDRIFYCDTDSIYFEVYENETMDDIKEKFFNDIDTKILEEYILSDSKYNDYTINDILKENLTSKKDYLKYLEKVNKYWLPNKINCSKGIVSKDVLWEIETNEPGEILVQGNKANIKCHWIDLNKITIYKTEKEKQLLIEKHIKEIDKLSDKEKQKYNTILISIKLFNKIQKKTNILLNNKLKIIKEQKNKGVSYKAIRTNHNLFYILLWGSIKSCFNEFKITTGQVVKPYVKYLGGLDFYLKDKIIESTIKHYEFLDKLPILDSTYEKAIDNLYELNYQKFEYTEQILEPFQMTNLNQNEKYFNKSGFDSLDDFENMVDYTKEKNEISTRNLDVELLNMRF